MQHNQVLEWPKPNNTVVTSTHQAPMTNQNINAGVWCRIESTQLLNFSPAFGWHMFSIFYPLPWQKISINYYYLYDRHSPYIYKQQFSMVNMHCSAQRLLHLINFWFSIINRIPFLNESDHITLFKAKHSTKNAYACVCSITWPLTMYTYNSIIGVKSNYNR